MARGENRGRRIQILRFDDLDVEGMDEEVLEMVGAGWPIERIEATIVSLRLARGLLVRSIYIVTR